MDLFQRRSFLRTLAAGATLALPGWALASNRLWMPTDDLPFTPQQTEGPFYPQPTIEQQLHNDTDLRRKLGTDALALGQPINLSGMIKTATGKPIQNAVVEVWQACASGRYNHARDQSQPKLDQNFQFWGRSVTAGDGKYTFQSIIPGKYPGRNGRHIHFRVDAAGHHRCSTQCYFDKYGEDNMRDGIYRSLDKAERKLVTVEVDTAKPAPAATQGAATSSGSANHQADPGNKKQDNSDSTAQSKAKRSNIVHPWQGVFDIVMRPKT